MPWRPVRSRPRRRVQVSARSKIWNTARSAPPRFGASACLPTSPAPCSILPPTRPTTSPARHSPSREDADMDTSTELANGLDRDLAALKAKAADYGARHHVVEKCTWPQGMRIAVNFTADFDAMLLRRVLNEPPMQLAKGEFGGRVGIWRLIELFDSHAIKATIFTPGRICELYPQAVKAASRSGHEIADHMWEHQVPKDPVLEREHLRRAKDAIEKLTGHRPVGTRSWHTRELLLEEGYIYNSHDTLDQLPHYVSASDGSGPLLNLPFHYAIDDAMFFSFAC